MNDIQSITLLELNRRVSRALACAPGLNDVWITAETSDLRVSGGHCYMELLHKENGRVLARCRAVMWASTYMRLGAKFFDATGMRLKSDIKIRVRVSVSFHEVYGYSLIIGDIDPSFTMGDLMRRRMEIIARLREEGVYDMNRSLAWPSMPCRVAVISAVGAAGFGDFMHHLHANPLRLRFETELFPAVLQGERTASSIIAALDAVMSEVEDFDCVVIIRGGGAVSDLASFDSYDLAASVAQFPLPVIVGIGHDRDENVLDFVANTRVKTPTAAAEFLIAHMTAALTRVREVGRGIMYAASGIIAARREQLAYYQGNIPALAMAVVDRNRRRIDRTVEQNITASVQMAVSRRKERLALCADALKTAASQIIMRRGDRLHALSELLDTISPEATLRRGYSITRISGHAVTDGDRIADGTVLTTTFAHGRSITSKSFSDNGR